MSTHKLCLDMQVVVDLDDDTFTSVMKTKQSLRMWLMEQIFPHHSYTLNGANVFVAERLDPLDDEDADELLYDEDDDDDDEIEEILTSMMLSRNSTHH